MSRAEGHDTKTLPRVDLSGQRQRVNALHARADTCLVLDVVSVGHVRVLYRRRAGQAVSAPLLGLGVSTQTSDSPSEDTSEASKRSTRIVHGCEFAPRSERRCQNRAELVSCQCACRNRRLEAKVTMRTSVGSWAAVRPASADAGIAGSGYGVRCIIKPRGHVVAMWGHLTFGAVVP